MKICILHIGHTEPGAASKFPPSPERFTTALTPHLPTAEFTTVSAVNDPLPQPHDFDAYLITGGKYSVFDPYPWQDRLFDFLHEVMTKKIPLAGICYGHQAIAHVLGAKVVRSEKGYGVGLMPVTVTADRPWCEKRAAPYLLHAMHQDQLVELPEDAELFLTSDFCPISGFTIGSAVFAIQQHPDFNSGLNQHLIEKRHERIGARVAADAIASLNGPDDTPTSVAWLAGFFTNAFANRKPSEPTAEVASA